MRGHTPSFRRFPKDISVLPDYARGDGVGGWGRSRDRACRLSICCDIFSDGTVRGDAEGAWTYQDRQNGSLSEMGG